MHQQDEEYADSEIKKCVCVCDLCINVHCRKGYRIRVENNEEEARKLRIDEVTLL